MEAPASPKIFSAHRKPVSVIGRQRKTNKNSRKNEKSDNKLDLEKCRRQCRVTAFFITFEFLSCKIFTSSLSSENEVA